MSVTRLINVTLCTFILTACNSENTNTEEEAPSEIREKPADTIVPLKQLLDERKEAFNKKASEEKKRIYAEGFEFVGKSGVLNSALNEGDRAPDFTLTDQTGQPVNLYETLKHGPVVLTWYRGGWCPYCNITLSYLQTKLPEFKEHGAQLVALTPELPDSSMSTSEELALEFDVLSDAGNAVAKQYGIVYQLSDAVAASYQESFGLHGYNGDESNELPLSATYVIDTTGTIRYAFLDVDYRNRAEPAEIIRILTEME